MYSTKNSYWPCLEESQKIYLPDNAQTPHCSGAKKATKTEEKILTQQREDLLSAPRFTIICFGIMLNSKYLSLILDYEYIDWPVTTYEV